ncbi:MAG TPA: gliding motility-associated C-terminal domain-containing protein [Ferruginibacter sp.]|nr:gliding motility-associated C-terminal domain-containing protein [Ferruginibacter sp.]
MNLFTFSKKALALCSFLFLSFFQFANATTYQSTGAGGLWSNPASWSPAAVPNAGDIVTIMNGSPIQITSPVACATITINTGGVLTMNSSMTVTGSFTVNGTLDCTTNFILGACNFTLANSNTAFLKIGDPNGITSGAIAVGNIENTGGRTFPSAANYVYDGIANQNTGNGLPTTINGGGSLTIDNTGTSPTNVVTLAATSSIQNLTLQAGYLSLPGKTVTVNGTILNTGGDLDSTVRANGGAFIVQGATITGPTTFYNLTPGGANSTITTSGLSSPLINGTLLLNTASRFGGTNSPRYAKGSTLSYAGNPNNRGLEWNADLSTPATIGVTQGYPDNVFINSGSDFDVCNYPNNGNDGAIPRGLDGDLTASAFTMLDWIPYTSGPAPYLGNPLLNQTGSFTVGHNMIVNSGGNINMSKIPGSGAFTIKGSLTINGAGANVNLDSMTNAFTVDSGIVMNNGTFNMGNPGVATQLNVTGDIVLNGGTFNGASGTVSLTGAWKRSGATFNAQNGTVDFNGTASQVITSTGGEVFNNVIINNPNDIGMTYSTTINGNLTFIQGLFLTYASADLTIGASGNIIGASQSTGWVARFSGGNLIRNITNTSPYLFAIGNINTYTPVTLTFSSVTTPGTVEMNTPGSNPDLSMPGIATYALSQVNYANWFWYIKQLTGSYGSYNADLNYGTASLQGSATVSSLETGVYDGTNWTYPPSSGSGTTVTATGITPLNGALENIGLANSACTPPTVYNVTGTGSYCSGAGLPVGLDNSQTGVNYQLQTAGPVNVGTPVAGTGSPVSFGNQPVGTYTVIATNAITSTCTSNMAGNAVITIGIPTAPTYTGIPPAEICVNNTGNYTTQLGQLNYVWTVPGVVGTDYIIASGGIGSTNPTVNLTWLTPGTKTVTVNYTSSGCTGAVPATNTTVVDTLPIPTFTTAPSGSICENSSVTYTTQTGQVFYSWTVPGVAGTDYTITSGGIGTTNNTVTLTWLTNGSKTVTVNYYNNITASCTGATPASSTITVNTPPTPTFTAEPGATACSNVAVTYTTQTGETNYVWNFGALADYTIISGGSATDNTTTLKWVTAGNKTVTINYTDINGCSATSATPSIITNVTVGPDASNLAIASTTPVCPASSGSTITVTSTTLPDGTYTVNYTLGAPNAGTPNATMIFSAGTGIFTVPIGILPTAGSTSITITAINNGCNTTGLAATNTIAVGANPVPTFTTQPGGAACVNNAVTYSTQTGKSNYTWTFDGTANVDYTIISGGTTTDSTVTLKWLTTGGKSVTVNYTSGCTTGTPALSTGTNVSESVDASNLSIASATQACTGTSGSTVTVNSTTLLSGSYIVTYDLSAPNATNFATATMSLSGGTGTFIIPSGSLHAVGSTTITIITITGSGCPATGLSVTGIVSVSTPPTPTFTTEPGASACDHTNLIYTTQSGESNYAWTYSGTLNTDYSIISGGGSTDNTVTLQWLTSGADKTVTVNYTNAIGCTATSATTSTPIQVNICNVLPLYIPSGFTPGGKNPVWHIQNSEDYPYMQVAVYDRWGKKVFECVGATTWDGTYQGQNLLQGVFVYVIKVNDERYKQILQGSITLIR